MNFAQTSLIAACALALTVGCTPKEASQSSPSKPAEVAAVVASAPSVQEPSLAIELESPDRAIKTWWRYLDLREQYDAQECKIAKDDAKSPTQKYLRLIAQSDVLHSLMPDEKECREDRYSREIQEVKTESETRAIVFALVKNTTPIPPGAEPDDLDKGFRRDGFRFKYVLEKSESGWKLSQVFKYEETNKILKKDVWESVYHVRSKPRYPAYVHYQ
jgi:hypothetical protein